MPSKSNDKQEYIAEEIKYDNNPQPKVAVPEQRNLDESNRVRHSEDLKKWNSIKLKLCPQNKSPLKLFYKAFQYFINNEWYYSLQIINCKFINS